MKTFPFWVLGGIWGGKAEPVRRFCNAYYDFLEECVHKHSDVILRSVAVPPGEGFRFEEALFRRLYADTSARRQLGMRVFTDNDIDWIRKLKRRFNVDANVAVISPIIDTGILYCLSGDSFPWKCLGREVSMLGSAYLFARLVLALCKNAWRRCITRRDGK